MAGEIVLSLHSNMFLLILKNYFLKRQDHLPLHSNMFLLIQELENGFWSLNSLFTFQYVSINTIAVISALYAFVSLHSNMFLLIPSPIAVPAVSASVFTFQYVSINTTQ